MERVLVRPILTVTVNPTVDLAFEVDRLDPTGKTRAHTVGVGGGGGGINVARVVRELGGDALSIHTAGQDVGRRLCRLLDGEGMPHSAVDVESETREAIVLFESGAQRSYHVVPAGPPMAEETGDRLIAAIAERLHDHDHVVASGSVPVGIADDFHARLAGAAKRSGCRFSLDSSGPAMEAALEEGVYLVKPNRREAAQIAGHEVTTFDDARDVNDLLLSRNAAQVVATTLGDVGALVSTSGSHFEVPTPDMPRPAISDAGAGDSFMGAMVLALAQGRDVHEAGQRGVAAAAAATMRAGTGLCERGDVEELIATM
ncbi:MAG: 1-phosphofructokinase family hexose kinase [Acidimicrobiales bacterium]